MHWNIYANPVNQHFQRDLEYLIDPNAHFDSSKDSNIEIIEIPEAELDRPFNENNEQLKYVPSLNLRNVLFLNDLRKIGDIKNQQVLFLIDYFSRCNKL